jgi:ATP sulfurylase
MKKKLSKQNLIAIIIVAVFTVGFAILLPIYLKANEDERQIYSDQKIRIIAYGETIGEYTIEELIEYSPAVEFDATYKPSGKDPIERTYTGIYMKDLLTAFGINLEDASSVLMTGSDGMQKVYTIADVNADGNVYISYLVNGKPFNSGIDAFAYTKPEEDGGPYVVIKAQDMFSQNRVKLLTTIEIQ